MTRMHNAPSKDEFQALFQDRGWPRLSVYTPTGRTSAEAEESRIRFKNQIQEAAGRLLAGGLRISEVQSFLAPVRTTMEDALFWQHQTEALCMFLSPNALRYYRLPYRVPEVVVVSGRFHIKPLIPVLKDAERFFLLAVGLRNVRLYEGTSFELRPLPLNDDLPAGVEELQPREDTETALQLHTTKGQGAGGIFHGHGETKDAARQKERILRYFQMVDQAVSKKVAGRQEPLILAGIEYLLPIYEQANSYPRIHKHGIRVNADSINEQELHRRALEIMKPMRRQRHQARIEQYQQMRLRKRTTSKLEEVLQAASAGRIETLWARADEYCWGRYDPETGRLDTHRQPQPRDEDLIDAATAEALRTGAEVVLSTRERMPAEATVAAVLRY